MSSEAPATVVPATGPRPRWSVDRPRARRWALAAAEVSIFLVLPYLVLWRYAPGLSPHTLGNDYVIYPFDAQLEIVWAWSRGLVPLYVPGFGGGHSVSALTLGQAWHPITWIAALVPAYGTGRAELVVTVLRFLELGLTHLALHRATRGTGLGWAPSFLLTFAVVFNARMLDSFRYGASLEGYCGMLLACAAFAAGWRRGWTPARVAMAAGAVYLTLVSGHPQWALFAVVAAGLFGLFLPLAGAQLDMPSEPALAEPSSLGPSAAEPPRRRLRYLAGFALACAIGSLLSAAYLLPFMLEFMKQNAGRVDQSYSFTLGYGDTVRGTLASFVRPLESDVHGAFGGNVLFLALLGAVPAALVVRRRPALAVLMPTLVLAIALLFSLGKATPVHAWMVGHLPLFSSFRVPGRINLWLPPMLLAIGWIVLADLERPELRRAWCRPPVIAIGAVLALIAVLVFQLAVPTLQPSGHAPPFITDVPGWATATLLALFGATGAMLVMTAAGPRMRRATWAIAIATTVAAGAIAISYGTWTSKRNRTRTLAAIDEHHRKKLSFVGDPGYGMSTQIVARAEAAKVVLKRPPGTLKPSKGAKRDAGTVTPRKIHWNEWTFDVAAPAGGTFVFGQPHLPEWRATLDGAPAPLTTEEGVFPALAVPPGEHVVSFRFVSVPSLVGGGLFFVTLAGGAVAWAAVSTASRRRRAIALGLALAAIGGVGVTWLLGQSPDLDLAPARTTATSVADPHLAADARSA